MSEQLKKLYCPIVSEYENVDRFISYMTIGMTLQCKRKSLHRTQEDMATFSNLSVSTIGRIEAGEEVKLTNVIRYAHALDMDLKLVDL